jgi:hypothetical protein
LEVFLSLIGEFPSALRDLQVADEQDLTAQLAALEERLGKRFSEIERRLDAAERMASERHKWTMEAVARLADINELRERMSAMEARQGRA